MPRDSALVHQVDNSRFAYRGDGVRAESHATAHTTEEPNQSQRAKVKIFPALTARSKVWGLVLSTLKYLRDRKKISRYLKIFPYLFAVWSDLINGNVVFFSVGRYFSRFFFACFVSNHCNHHLAGRAKQQTRPAAAVFGCPGEFGARSRWVCKLARSPARSTPRGGAKHEEPGGLGETQSKTGSNHRSAEQPPHNSATQSLGTCKCTISGFSSVWIRPFIGGGHTVWPVLPRSSIFKKTNLQKQDRVFQGNLENVAEGSCS